MVRGAREVLQPQSRGTGGIGVANGFAHRIEGLSAFVACEFNRCNFFDATLEGCKLSGSVFVDCTLRPLTVTGGNCPRRQIECGA